jgi:hypothetical protein
MEWLIALWVLSGIVGYAIFWLCDLDLTWGGVSAALFFGPIPGPIWLLIGLLRWLTRRRSGQSVVLIQRFRD